LLLAALCFKYFSSFKHGPECFGLGECFGGDEFGGLYHFGGVPELLGLSGQANLSLQKAKISELLQSVNSARDLDFKIIKERIAFQA